MSKCKTCEHALNYQEAEGRCSVQCQLVNDLVGMPCGHNGLACDDCNYDKGDDSFIRARAKGHLRNLITNGNQPRFEHQKDLIVLGENFAALSTEQERIDLLAKSAEKLTNASALKAEDVLYQLEKIEMGLGTGALEAIL